MPPIRSFVVIGMMAGATLATVLSAGAQYGPFAIDRTPSVQVVASDRTASDRYARVARSALRVAIDAPAAESVAQPDTVDARDDVTLIAEEPVTTLPEPKSLARATTPRTLLASSAAARPSSSALPPVIVAQPEPEPEAAAPAAVVAGPVEAEPPEPQPAPAAPAPVPPATPTPPRAPERPLVVAALPSPTPAFRTDNSDLFNPAGTLAHTTSSSATGDPNAAPPTSGLAGGPPRAPTDPNTGVARLLTDAAITPPRVESPAHPAAGAPIVPR